MGDLSMADVDPSEATKVGATLLTLGVGGLFGSIHRWLRNRNRPFDESVAQAVGGVFSAVFLGWLVSTWLGGGLPGLLAAGYLCGLFGEVMADVVYKALKARAGIPDDN